MLVVYKNDTRKLQLENIDCKVDTGADVNILNSEIASLLEMSLQTSKVNLKSYSGTKIEVEEKLQCLVLLITKLMLWILR